MLGAWRHRANPGSRLVVVLDTDGAPGTPDRAVRACIPYAMFSGGLDCDVGGARVVDGLRGGLHGVAFGPTVLGLAYRGSSAVDAPLAGAVVDGCADAASAVTVSFLKDLALTSRALLVGPAVYMLQMPLLEVRRFVVLWLPHAFVACVCGVYVSHVPQPRCVIKSARAPG